jgi:hypothetical protein
VRAARPERIAALLAEGAHRGARLEAEAVLADPQASPDEREAARGAILSLRPEPGALVVGAAGAVFALALALWALGQG